MKCSESVPIDNLRSTYCSLEKGHDGKHVANKNTRIMVMRCNSTNLNGIQCGFPAGHLGKHGNGPQIPTWE